MRNSHLSPENRKLYNWCKNSFIFDRETGKEIIINDCLAVSDFYFKDGYGYITTHKDQFYITYFSKLSKQGFEYSSTAKKQEHILIY